MDHGARDERTNKLSTLLNLDTLSAASKRSGSRISLGGGPGGQQKRLVSPLLTNQQDFQQRTGLPFCFTKEDMDKSKDVSEWNSEIAEANHKLKLRIGEVKNNRHDNSNNREFDLINMS